MFLQSLNDKNDIWKNLPVLWVYLSNTRVRAHSESRPVAAELGVDGRSQRQRKILQAKLDTFHLRVLISWHFYLRVLISGTHRYNMLDVFSSTGACIPVVRPCRLVLPRRWQHWCQVAGKDNPQGKSNPHFTGDSIFVKLLRTHFLGHWGSINGSFFLTATQAMRARVFWHFWLERGVSDWKAYLFCVSDWRLAFKSGFGRD
jgi:hypothetical protein